MKNSKKTSLTARIIAGAMAFILIAGVVFGLLAYLV